MTDDQLHDAILADPQAKALADAGNDAGCAARLAAILPPAVGSKLLAEGGILRALGPVAGNAALTAIETAAIAAYPAGDPRAGLPPILARVVRLLRDIAGGGLDFGDPTTRAMLDQLAAAGILQAADVATLKAVAEVPASVPAGAVSQAWARHRPGNRVGGTP